MRPVSRFIGVWKVILADAKLFGGSLLRFQINDRVKQQCIPVFFFFCFFFKTLHLHVVKNGQYLCVDHVVGTLTGSTMAIGKQRNWKIWEGKRGKELELETLTHSQASSVHSTNFENLELPSISCSCAISKFAETNLIWSCPVSAVAAQYLHLRKQTSEGRSF